MLLPPYSRCCIEIPRVLSFTGLTGNSEAAVKTHEPSRDTMDTVDLRHNIKALISNTYDKKKGHEHATILA